MTPSHRRAIDRIAKEMADEILRDPIWIAEMRVLARRAVERALRNQQRQHPEREAERDEIDPARHAGRGDKKTHDRQ